MVYSARRNDTKTTTAAAGAAGATSRHSRKISWGGTTIEIPNVFESHLSLDNDDYATVPVKDFNVSNPFYGAVVGGPSLGLPTELSQPNIPLKNQSDIPQPPPLKPATLFHGSD